MKWILALLIVALCCAQMVSAWDRIQKKDNHMDLEEKAIMDSEGEKIIDLQEEINRLSFAPELVSYSAPRDLPRRAAY